MANDAPLSAGRVDPVRAVREAGFTALVSAAILLPFIALVTVQDMDHKLILETRWPLYFEMIGAIFVLRLIALLTFSGSKEKGAGLTLPATVQKAAGPAFILFLVAVPPLVYYVAGAGNIAKYVDNYGIQILIYIMLGWGLNVVVGLAGLLDLGYVAFYAVGAYSYALLAKTFGFSFWVLLPMAGIFAATWGIILGFPVLRLRGDYLAIVTLAFGEIIRLVLVNWVDFSGGYAGISGIPRPTLFGIPFNASDQGFAAVFGLEFSPNYRARCSSIT